MKELNRKKDSLLGKRSLEETRLNAYGGIANKYEIM
jgi:hypothetical protein